MAKILGTKVFVDGFEQGWSSAQLPCGELGYRIQVPGESQDDPWEYYNGLGCGPEMVVVFTEFGDLYRFLADEEKSGQEWYGPMYKIVIVQHAGEGRWIPTDKELV
jgi:hypothetical protein